LKHKLSYPLGVNYKRLRPNQSPIALVFFILCFGSNLNAQNFPKLGNDSLLDVACWNVEWLGSTSGGPSDETTQYNNVLALLNKTELDVIALEEISNPSTYNTLSLALASKYDTYISDFSQTQKTGIYWRKSMFSLIASNTFNLPLNSSDNYAFASRPPLQICLKTIGGTKTDTLYFLVLHMKAQTESTDAGRFESYTRRQNAANALKLYIETNLVNKKYIVLGDWNDDLDVSIYNSLETPYKGLLNAKYTFPSQELTKAGKASYAFADNMIDHIMNSKTLDSFYYTNSAKVFDNADNFCSGFSNNTSDHFPVYAFYNWKKLTTYVPGVGIENQLPLVEINIYPNPVRSELKIQSPIKVIGVELLNVHGQKVGGSQESSNDLTLNLNNYTPGLYFLKIETENGVTIRKILKD
jgi:hypothetical protein